MDSCNGRTDATLSLTEVLENPSNEWEGLVPLIAPVILNSLPDQDVWKELDSGFVKYLVNTVSGAPWFNHLAMAAAVMHLRGNRNLRTPVGLVHRFLRWAIPERYPDIDSLVPACALEMYIEDSRTPGRAQTVAFYRSAQKTISQYVDALPPKESNLLQQYQLPKLCNSRRLNRLVGEAKKRTRERTKRKVFPIADELPSLVAMARERLQWITDLDTLVQDVSHSVDAGLDSLPVEIGIQGFDGESLIFRVWDHGSWILAHKGEYAQSPLTRARRKILSKSLFLQLVGEMPKHPWFLQTIAVGALQGVNRQNASQDCLQYLQEWRLPWIESSHCPGMLAPDLAISQILRSARHTAGGTPDDSTMVFAHEPLLVGAVLGFFALICCVSTGMRIGELQQLTLDGDCMQVGALPVFDDETQSWVKANQKVYWQLFPKLKDKRCLYPATRHMLEAMRMFMDIHRRFCGDMQLVQAGSRRHFCHNYRFPGKQKFVLQWNGKHVESRTIRACLAVLLLENPCRDSC